MGKLRSIVTNGKVIVLIVCLVLGFIAISPNPWAQGVMIKAIEKNSSAELAGMEAPKATLAPMARERIIAVNNRVVANVGEYFDAIASLAPDESVQLKTTKRTYTLRVRPKVNRVVLNETEEIVVNVTQEVTESVNGSDVLVNKTQEVVETRPKVVEEVVGVESLGISVDNAPKSNLRRGLDLQGGTRVVLRPVEDVSSDTLNVMVDSLTERLNVYGLSDVVVTVVSDRPDFLGGGNRFILVEIAGASEAEVRELLGKQGKFEARIANVSVFKGGEDITYVCRTAQCSGIDPQRGCSRSGDSWSCSFMFSISLSPAAAHRQSDLTKNLRVVDGALSEQLVLLLDDQEVDRLSIDASLRGRAVTDIAISGGGFGISQQSAIEDALQNMKRLQTILVTGSLPVKLEIERIDSISPKLGKEFLSNAFFVAVIALGAVAVSLIFVYRKLLIAVPILFTALSEIFLTFAMAALIGWNIDLAAIAGIILAIGMGVNDQVVITDEALRSGNFSERVYNWKERIKRAFFIIFSGFLSVVVAMVPLLFAGAGLLKGFAITTILAVTIGVLVTRPAYAAIVQLLVEK